MAEPVLVVHGVANRDEAQFEAQVRDLNRRVGVNFDFIPVFWGNLGASVNGIADTLPTITDVVPGLLDDLLRERSGSGALRATSIDAKMIVIGAAQNALAPTPAGVQSLGQAQSAEVALAIRQAWDSTKFLKTINDEATLRRIGKAVGDAAVTYSHGQSALRYQVTGVFPNLEEFAKSVIGAIDDALAAAFGNVAVFIQYLREQLDPGVARFLGDVFVYQAHRDRILQRITDALAPLPGGRAALATQSPSSDTVWAA